MKPFGVLKKQLTLPMVSEGGEEKDCTDVQLMINTNCLDIVNDINANSNVPFFHFKKT